MGPRGWTGGRAPGWLERVLTALSERSGSPLNRLGAPTTEADQRLRDAVLLTRPRLERLLHDNLLPFWQDRARDDQVGGFHCHYAADGSSAGPAPKYLVSQARLTWFFARLARDGHSSAQHAALAAHGCRFLAEHLWDRVHGGFLWSVEAGGPGPGLSDKRLYGQAFAMFALYEAARLPELRGVRSLADQAAILVRTHLHDPAFGGYFRSRSRDWSAPGDPGGYWDGALKSMNDHLHVLEPLLARRDLDPAGDSSGELLEVLFILATIGPDPATGGMREAFRADWSPVDPEPARVSHGHSVEAAWLLPVAAEAAGWSPGVVLGPVRAWMDHALRYGWDGRAAGFLESGRGRRPADRRDKVWWAQAEGLVACLWLYLRGEDGVLARRYLELLDWIEHHQVDWAGGEWHHTVTPARRVTGEKAGPWRDPYHQGRALLTCLDLLGRHATTPGGS